MTDSPILSPVLSPVREEFVDLSGERNGNRKFDVKSAKSGGADALAFSVPTLAELDEIAALEARCALPPLTFTALISFHLALGNFLNACPSCVYDLNPDRLKILHFFVILKPFG